MTRSVPDSTAAVPGSPASLRTRLGALIAHHRLTLAAGCLVLAFLVLVARFWHPYYGMTRLLQFGSDFAEVAIPEIRSQPVFIYPHHGGYDGLHYAQLAFHPGLDAPELATALDNPGFRARRILMSATAWLVAGGDPAHIANVFSWLNFGIWLVLAALLWRLLAVEDWRGWAAWAGLMFSAGVLHSVRQSLTDLPALLLIAGALFLVERGGLRPGVALLAAAALTRETSVLAAVGPAALDLRQARSWWRNLAIGLAVCLPLALWLLYVRQRFGPGDAGAANFTWPLLGWLRKWPELVHAYAHPAFRWLVTTTLLATIGISAQAAFFVVHRRLHDPWWRLGAVHVVLAACLGQAVWEGHPGSFTRILLPLSLAFAVCAVRWRVSPVWLLAGALPIFAGLEPWRKVVNRADDLSSGRVAGQGYLARLEQGFFPREARKGHVRAWSSGRGSIEIHFTAPPKGAQELEVGLEVRGFGPRTLEIADATGSRWLGTVQAEWLGVTRTIRPTADGRWLVHLSSPEPATREAEVPGARDLAFCVRDVHVRAVR